jgi:type VI secretion system secreted protein VgrG
MSQQGLRFTLDVDGLLAMSTAVVSFTLCQNLSTPFRSASISPAVCLTSPPRFSREERHPHRLAGECCTAPPHGIITGVELGKTTTGR